MKITNVNVTFYFGEEFDYKTVEKFGQRIQKFVNATHVPVSANIFTGRNEMTAIINVDEEYMDKSDWARIERRLDTLINSHKEPATWGYGIKSIRFTKAA